MSQSTIEKKVWIPEVPKEQIVLLAKRIKPVYDFGHKHYIKPVDLFSVAYTWEPKKAKRVVGLKALCDIRTYHGFGYHGFFKPSIAEVLAQIPAEHLSKVVAFEIVDCPKDADDLNKEKEALNAGYHVASTRLYIRE